MHRLIIAAQREARFFASTRWLWGGGASSPDAGKKRPEIEGQECEAPQPGNICECVKVKVQPFFLGIHKGARPSALIVKGELGMSGFELPSLRHNSYITAVKPTMDVSKHVNQPKTRERKQTRTIVGQMMNIQSQLMKSHVFSSLT